MFRVARMLFLLSSGFPHSRGDVPVVRTVQAAITKFSPLTWGCSGEASLEPEPTPVFPTHVGMFLASIIVFIIPHSFPHSRGDVPLTLFLCAADLMFSPLTWGCSLLLFTRFYRFLVFPTHVGMFRDSLHFSLLFVSFPHSRGDVPAETDALLDDKAFSPLTWGCSMMMQPHFVSSAVFPTHVGMFRSPRSTLRRWSGFPHSRGDVPYSSRSCLPCP